MPYSFCLDVLWNEKWVAVKLLFCAVLRPGFVKTVRGILLYCPFNLFSGRVIKIKIFLPYSSTDTARPWKNSPFASERSDFHIVDNLSIVVHVLPMRRLTSLPVDETSLSRNMNWSTYFRGLSFIERMSPSRQKQMNSGFIWVHCVVTEFINKEQWIRKRSANKFISF